MAKRSYFILMIGFLIAGLSSCKEEDLSRSEKLLVRQNDEWKYNPTFNLPKEGTYQLYVDANVDYTVKFETGTLIKDWLSIDSQRKDAATGYDVITFSVKPQEGAPTRRTGMISLMSPDNYLCNFITINQGFAARAGGDFRFLQYGSANPLEGLGGRLISAWNETQLDEGWTSTKFAELDEAYCYGRNGFIQLGDDEGHGADLFTPYTTDLRRDTVILAYFDAVAYANADGVKDNVNLTVEIIGGGEFTDGSRSKTISVGNLDPTEENVASSMWKGRGNQFFIVSKPGNMISASTQLRLMDGTMDNGAPTRVFIDNFYLYTVPHENWDALFGGLKWVEDAKQNK